MTLYDRLMLTLRNDERPGAPIARDVLHAAIDSLIVEYQRRFLDLLALGEEVLDTPFSECEDRFPAYREYFAARDGLIVMWRDLKVIPPDVTNEEIIGSLDLMIRAWCEGRACLSPE